MSDTQESNGSSKRPSSTFAANGFPKISKEEYIAKQSENFAQLTGFSSWDDWRQNMAGEGRAPESEIDRDALIYALNLTTAALDEDTYNEVNAQRAIDANFRQAAGQGLKKLNEMPNNEEKCLYLTEVCEQLRDQVNELEISFLNSRKIMSTVMANEAQMKSRLEVATTTNQRLATMSKSLELKIESYHETVKNFKTDNRQLSLQVLDFEKQLSELKNKAQEKEAMLRQAENENIKKLKDESQKLKDEMKQQNEMYLKLKEYLKKQMEESKKLKENTKKYDDLKKSNEGFKRQNEELKKSNEGYKKQNEELRKSNEEYKKQVFDLDGKLKQMERSKPLPHAESNDVFTSHQIQDLCFKLGVEKKHLYEGVIKLLLEKTKLKSTSTNTLKQAKQNSFSILDNHPLLEDLIKEVELAPNNKQTENHIDAIKREYPELLSKKLGEFWKLYESREDYFKDLLRQARLKASIFARRYEKNKIALEQAVNRSTTLSGLVKDNSKKLKSLNDKYDLDQKAMNELKEALALKNSQTEEMDKTIKSLEEEQRVLKEQVSRDYESLMTCREALEEVKGKLESKNIGRMEKYVNSSKDLIDNIVEKSQSFQREFLGLRSVIEALKTERRDFIRKYNDLVSEYTSSRSLCRTLLKERDEYEFALIKLEGKSFKSSMSGASKKSKYSSSSAFKKTRLSHIDNGDEANFINSQNTQNSEKMVLNSGSNASVAGLSNDSSFVTNTKLDSGHKTNEALKAYEASIPELNFRDDLPIFKEEDIPSTVPFPEALVDQFDSSPNSKEFFTDLFGFDITGMSLAESLQKYSANGHGPNECKLDSCLVHDNKSSPLGNMMESTLRKVLSPEFINGKKVFGPERPPSMSR